MDDRLEIATNHPANHWEQVRVLDFLDNVLTLEAREPSEARLVLRSSDPLSVAEANGVEVTLMPGWDGTLGYSLYGLNMRFVEPGIATVALRRELPPAEPKPTSREAIADWQRTFAERASRFPDDASDFATWQANQRLLLTGALAADGAWPHRVPAMAEVTKREDRDGFTLLHMRYWSQAGRQTTLLLSQPSGAARAPLLVALHGHEATWGGVEADAFDLGHVDDFCAHFARAGWAVLQPATMDHELQNVRGTLHGDWTWDIMRAVDVAADQPFVDGDRVATCGLSTVAHLAMTLLALDSRVMAGVVGCVFGHWHHYDHRFRMPPHCDCGLRGQVGAVMEQVDWLALAAPKPVQLQYGMRDVAFCPGGDETLLDLQWNTGVMPQAEFDTLTAELHRAWQTVGAKPPTVHLHPQGHRVDGQAALSFLQDCV